MFGVTGFLVDSVDRCDDRTEVLLEHPEDAAKMENAGRERVRKNFHSIRHLADYLELFNKLS